MTTASADKDEEFPPDWAEAYTTLISHTSMHYDEIGERTIPQLEAILGKLNKHICLKMGIPWETKDAGVAIPQAKAKKGKAPKLSELAAFCGSFRGVK